MNRLCIVGGIVGIGALYLTGLTSMGLVSTDEPRYAAIGQAMAQSGDWITPRLWGHPWFEKPALLYWMTAAGFRFGLNPDLAPRLPVALLSVAFLAFFWWKLRAEWDARVASYSTAILATSAGWLAYSHVAVTDLPLAAFFTAAVLFSIGKRRNLIAAWACLGLAVMAKGLVPLVLYLPVMFLYGRRLKDWFPPVPLLVFAIIAIPWYFLCTLQNGPDFLRVFFMEHTFGRFTSDAMQHVQPWWFYLPAALLLLFPWFPLLAFAGRALKVSPDTRLKTLAVVVVFGVVFFSLAVNKLPGYLLPLLPSACLLMGFGVSVLETHRLAAVGPLTLLGALPAAAQVLPGALAHGLRSANIPWLLLTGGLIVGALAGLALTTAARRYAFPLTATIVGVSFICFQIILFPAVDKAASARPIWLESHPGCIGKVSRSLEYGLNYYAARQLPACGDLDRDATRVVR